MAFQQQHTSSSLSKVSIQLQCPSQTFVSTRRSPYSTSSKGKSMRDTFQVLAYHLATY